MNIYDEGNMSFTLMDKINAIILPAKNAELIDLTEQYLLGIVKTETETDFESKKVVEKLVLPILEDEESERNVEILGHTILISDDEFRILQYEENVCVNIRVKNICGKANLKCSDIIIVYEFPPDEYLYLLAELEMVIMMKKL